ncbi:mechanosensitive ion channel domain-containing protein [Desulfolutivibrio sulfoxidireducens]|uniref:mechanosensitive ion channel domain-containing protein n=1 Tax=Desulfolutivibrio sulfoxidireducens TaxID=2773299 RepID=UPI001FE87381|nr:mechanosensitive ion channel domain-containing protein [Desulfolutivibrio sulfoxidireducens]
MRAPVMAFFVGVVVMAASFWPGALLCDLRAQPAPREALAAPAGQGASPPARDGQGPETDHDAEAKTWRTIVSGIEKDLDLRIRQTETLRRMLPDMKNDLGDALAKADNRLDQLILLRGVAGETPWAFRSILIQLRELERYVELKRSPLDDRQARLAQAKQDYASIRAIRKKGLTLDYAAGTSDTLDAPVARFRAFKKDLDEIKAEVDAALSQATVLQADIASARQDMAAGFVDSLKRYYFAPSDNLLTMEGWQSLADDLTEWGESFPRFCGPLVTWVRWTPFFLYAVSFFSLFVLAAVLVASRRRNIPLCDREASIETSTDMLQDTIPKTPVGTPPDMSSTAVPQIFPVNSNEMPCAPSQDTPKETLQDRTGPPSPANGRPDQKTIGGLGPGWLVIFAGLALFLADQLTFFTDNQFVSLGWVTLTALGGMLVLSRYPAPWVGVSRAGCVSFGKRPIFVFFLLFALGAFFLAINVPGTVVGLLWAVACLVASIRLYRLRTLSPGASRLRGFAVVTGYGMALMIPACLAGFGPQALIVTQAFFMLLLTLGISGAVTRGLTALAARGEGKRGLGMTLPFAQTVIYALYFTWVLHYMGGPGFADHVMDLSLHVGVATITPGAVVELVIAFFLARIVLTWLGGLVEVASFRGKRLDQGLAHALKNMASYLVWVGYVLFCLHIFGISLHALAWIASGLSVGIGFGLKDIVNNFVSGLIIMFGGSIKKGDIIQQGKNLGQVESVSIRNTIVRTLDNTMVIIPNSSFLRGEIVNLSYQDATMRLTIPIAVAPGAKIKKVRKLLLEAAKENEDVLKKPKPEVNIRQFGRIGVEFDLYVWIDNFMKKFKVESDLMTEIDKRFQENKIMLAFQSVKIKYKPKGTEEMQIEEARTALREKRGETFRTIRQIRRVHARRKWNLSRVTVKLPE